VRGRESLLQWVLLSATEGRRNDPETAYESISVPVPTLCTEIDLSFKSARAQGTVQLVLITWKPESVRGKRTASPHFIIRTKCYSTTLLARRQSDMESAHSEGRTTLRKHLDRQSYPITRWSIEKAYSFTDIHLALVVWHLVFDQLAWAITRRSVSSIQNLSRVMHCNLAGSLVFRLTNEYLGRWLF
jgi:hypothetical protein